LTTRPSDRNIRIAAALIVVAGLAACTVAIFSEQLGLGAEVARGMFGWKRISLLAVGVLVLTAGTLLLTRPEIASKLVTFGAAKPFDRTIRWVGGLILVAGLVACALAILSEELGLGAEAARGMFGWKRVSLLVAGGIACAAGALLLFHPQLVASRFDARSVNLVRVVLAALLLGSVINIIYFPIIEDRVGGGWRALAKHTYDSFDDHGVRSAERRYGFFIALGEVAPGARLIVPPPKPPTHTRLESFRQQIFGLGRISEFDHREYDVLTFGDDVDPRGQRVQSGRYGKESAYRIVVLDDSPEELLFLMPTESDILVVDTRLLPADALEALGS
jgi:hypothetical protein